MWRIDWICEEALIEKAGYGLEVSDILRVMVGFMVKVMVRVIVLFTQLPHPLYHTVSWLIFENIY